MKDDVISRQAAIDAVNGMPDCPNGYSDTYDKAHIIAVLEDVPSVQTDMSGDMSGTHKPLDCISRQAVIDKTKSMFAAAKEWYGEAEDDEIKARAESCMMTNVEIKLWVDKLPSVQPQRWIPLKEAVPEPDERVVVTTGGYEYHVWDCMSNRGDDYFWEDEEGDYHNKYAVIAWMPLPDPYTSGADMRGTE